MTPSSSRRWAALVLGVALTFGSSLPVLALTPAPTNAEAMTPAQRAEWERLRNEGKAAAQVSDWKKALKAYQGAWLIHKDWNLAANLGKVELSLGKHLDAADHLEYAVREAPKNLATDAPDEWAALRELYDKARAKVGALVINVEPAGAEVLVNGLAVGKAPLPGPVFVLPGAVTVEARAEGFALGSAPTQAVAGNEQKVSLALAAIPGAKRVDLVKGPGPVGSGNPPPPVVPQKRSVLPAVVLWGVGGAAVVAGAVLEGVAASELGTVKKLSGGIDWIKNNCARTAPPLTQEQATQCSDLTSKAKHSDTVGNAGVGLLVVGGAAAAGGLVYFLWPEKRAQGAARPLVVPVVSAGGGGLVVSGTF